MKSKSVLVLFAFFLIANSFGQRTNYELTFSAIDSISYIKMDSIKIINRSQGDQNMHFWPDTSIILSINPGDTMLYIGYAAYEMVGIPDIILKPPLAGTMEATDLMWPCFGP